MPDPLPHTSIGEESSVSNHPATIPATVPRIQDHFTESATYCISLLDKSPATLIVHTTVEDKPYCIKLWRPFQDSVYDTRDIFRNNYYTLNGLAFNTQFAPGIYLGIAPIQEEFDEQDTSITLGPINVPKRQEDLEPGISHALIMRYIEQNLRLDNQIKTGTFGSSEDLGFLASKISSMHTRHIECESNPDQYRNIKALQKKWNFNKQCLLETLRAQSFSAARLFNQARFFTIMDTALKTYQERFQERSKCVRRCHGDLKTNNLWLLPGSHRLLQNADIPKSEDSRHLYVLDCIDFNPFLYYIDPLSDVAMLAMDLEEKLSSVKGEEYAKTSVNTFLEAYLTSIAITPVERSYLDPVLEFYIVEKAIVGAAVSVLSDNLPDLGERYLYIAQTHLDNLSRLLPIADAQTFYAMQQPLSNQTLLKAGQEQSGTVDLETVSIQEFAGSRS